MPGTNVDGPLFVTTRSACRTATAVVDAVLSAVFESRVVDTAVAVLVNCAESEIVLAVLKTIVKTAEEADGKVAIVQLIVEPVVQLNVGPVT